MPQNIWMVMPKLVEISKIFQEPNKIRETGKLWSKAICVKGLRQSKIKGFAVTEEIEQNMACQYVIQKHYFVAENIVQ